MYRGLCKITQSSGHSLRWFIYRRKQARTTSKRHWYKGLPQLNLKYDIRPPSLYSKVCQAKLCGNNRFHGSNLQTSQNAHGWMFIHHKHWDKHWATGRSVFVQYLARLRPSSQTHCGKGTILRRAESVQDSIQDHKILHVVEWLIVN
jgi:hypothetical protein